MLIDAGAHQVTERSRAYVCDARPSDSRRPGEWIGRYVLRQMRAAKRAELDAVVITHFHDDHLAGLADVASMVPVKRLIDRAYPDYSGLEPFEEALVKPYREKFPRVEKFRVGSASQLGAKGVEIRNLAANGVVWTGRGEEARSLFQGPSTENMRSIAMRLQWGAFRYYTGGDLTCDTAYGREPWRDIETPVARVAGPVDVAVLNHHGYVDSTGPEFVRALQPKVFIIPGWDSSHPAANALRNLFSLELYAGPREVYSTATKPETKVAIRQLADLASSDGHVLVRVTEDGAKYRVIVTSNADELDRIIRIS